VTPSLADYLARKAEENVTDASNDEEAVDE
jgi:hypothetical protein